MEEMGLPAINQRVKDLVKDLKRGNVTAFSRDLGYSSPQRINRLFKIEPRVGRYPGVSLGIIMDISNKFDISQDWLIHGTGEKTKMQEEGLGRNIVDTDILYIPFVNQYGRLEYISNYNNKTYMNTLPKIPWLTNAELSGNLMIFEASGSSMDDGLKHSIEHGDLLLCKEIERDNWNDRFINQSSDIFVIVSNKRVTVKEIIDYNPQEDLLMLHSYNPNYSDYTMCTSDIVQIFCIVGQQKIK